MNKLTRFTGNQALMQTDGIFDFIDNEEKDKNMNLLSAVRRKWQIVLVTMLLICGIGMPVIWLMVKPFYVATAAIRVAPVISSILFGGEEGIPMYKNFMFTQADLITSDAVLQRVADDMTDKGIDLSTEPPNPLEALKNKVLKKKTNTDIISSLRKALVDSSLVVAPENNTELIKISMKSSAPAKAAKIANSFVQAYMQTMASEELKDGDYKLTVLEDERRAQADKIEKQRKTLNAMAQEYGTEVLDDRQQIMMNHVAKLQEKLTDFEMEKIVLQTKIGLRETKKGKKITSEDLAKMRYEFINTDLMVQTITSNVANLEQALIIARQQLAPTNPELARKDSLLAALKQRLDEQREVVSQNFDKIISKELEKEDFQQVNQMKEQLEQITIHEQQLRHVLAKEDIKTIELGRKQLAMQDVKEQLIFSKELYDTIQRRISELEMERKRLARISVAYLANTAPYQDKRVKYSLALIMAGLMSSIGLAVLLNKLDLSLKTPDDVAKRIDVKILGTTTSRQKFKKALWPQRIADDYHTICINLGLMNNCNIPGKLVITSAGPREGKSTLAVNMASNLAKNGKKVLLIDGDLRKPDIARLLNLDNKGKGIHWLLTDYKLEDLLIYTGTPGLAVLTAETCDVSTINKLIHHKNMIEFIAKISRAFDHVIIDSPPILAVVDALAWASMVDGVILTSFAGQTETPHLKEAIDRLKQINVNILGIVLSNVRHNNIYYPYGYGHCKPAVIKNYKPENILLPEKNN